MDKVEAARIALLKAEAELSAVLFEESAQGNPWVQAEDGHWMSNEE